jgi:hypothetical protein
MRPSRSSLILRSHYHLSLALVFGVAQVRVAARDRRERLRLKPCVVSTPVSSLNLISYVNLNTVPSSFKELQSRPPAEQVKFIQFGQENGIAGDPGCRAPYKY